MWNILDGTEALMCLEATGTVSEAAVRLRLTQSAVSKRIKTLEGELGRPLVEADGRKLRLTPAGFAYLAKARPLVSELNRLKSFEEAQTGRELSIGISDSIASSWGPDVLQRALSATPGVSLQIHVHRSLLVLERIRLGHYDLGIVTGKPSGSDLSWTRLAEERMVLVGSDGDETSRKILTIEQVSATWREIGNAALAHPRIKGSDFVFLESFAAAAQMAKAGFGRALVPLGTAMSLGFRDSDIKPLSPHLRRQVHLVSRKGIRSLESVLALETALSKAASKAVR